MVRRFACQEARVFLIAAIVAFAVALILCLAVHTVTGWWPKRGA